MGDAHALFFVVCVGLWGSLEQVSSVGPMQGAERLDRNLWVLVCATTLFSVYRIVGR
jgi:hypothetical protein